MPATIVPDNQLPAVTQSLSKDVARINAAHAEAQTIQRHALDASKAIAKQVVGKWVDVGAPLEKLKAKIDKQNTSAREYNRKYPNRKQKDIVLWGWLFKDKKTKDSPANSLVFSFTQMKSDHYRKAAKYPSQSITAIIDSGKQDINITYQALSDATPEKEEAAKLLLTSTKTLAAKFTGNDEWYTPIEYIDAARDAMGSIDLDPASNDEAQQRVNAGMYYTVDNCGLSQEWHGNVWMNPPYSKELMPKFMAKLLAEWKAGHITQAIVLTNNNTDTAWFQDAAAAASAICFTRGRISFYCGDITSSPTNGQSFFYFGTNHDGFASAFRSIGMVCHAT